jgi:Nuclease-related domain
VLSDRPADALDPNRHSQQGARYGLPGGSALAEYRRRRNGELAAQLPSLPLRLAGVAAAGLTAGFLAARLAIPLAVVPVVIVVAGWLLRPRLTAGTVAWRRGARGERATARRLRDLQRAGWTVFHDVALQGSRANLDHLLISPGGVFVIDSKYYRGRIRVGRDGALWYGRHPLSDMLRAVQWEAARATRALATPGITVEPLVCVHRGQLPWSQLQGPVPVLTPTQLAARLASLPPWLSGDQVAQLTRQAMGRLRPATSSNRAAPEQGGIGR